MLLDRVLDALIKTGTLTLIDAKGRRHTASGAPGPEVTVRLHDAALNRSLVFDPALKVGEAYMDGTLTVEDGDVYDFLSLAVMNLGWRELRSKHGLWRHLTRRLGQADTVAKARANVAHHYDLSGTLYDLFLDRDRQYSCAYYVNPDESLEAAQDNKKRHIAAKLVLKPQSRVLDIGSGWGGLALYLAQVCGAHVTGVTLSTEQLEVARTRAKESALTERVEFRLEDYRDVSGRFDRIVSVGMFEHVGIGHYREFFDKARDLLSDDGVMLLHTIGRSFGPGVTGPWVRKYMFPGGYAPALFRGAAGHRAGRAARYRHRDSAPALRRDAEGVAGALQSQPRAYRRALRRAVLPHVGVLPGWLRGEFPLRRHRRVSDPAVQAIGNRSAHPRLYRRMGAGARGQEIRSRLNPLPRGERPARRLGLARDHGEERAGRAGGDAPALLPVLNGPHVEPVGCGERRLGHLEPLADSSGVDVGGQVNPIGLRIPLAPRDGDGLLGALYQFLTESGHAPNYTAGP